MSAIVPSVSDTISASSVILILSSCNTKQCPYIKNLDAFLFTCLYMTGLAKTVPNGTRTEMQFIT